MTDAPANHDAATPAGDTPERRQALLGGPQKIALFVGVAGLVAFGVLAAVYMAVAPSSTADEKHLAVRQPFLSYLTGFMFWTLVGLGSVFFLMIQYVTGGRWGILLRRPLEANYKTLIVLGPLLFIPVAATMFMGENSIYWWAQHHATHMADHQEGEHPGVGAQTAKEKEEPATTARPDVVTPNLNVDEEKKIADWLFPSFAVIRGYFYFIVFGGLLLWMLKNARTAEFHDNLDVARAARDRQKYVGTIGLFTFAILMTWIATDWLMSLETTFASSMFPVIMFDNSAVTAYAIGLLTLLYLKKKGEPQFTHLFPAGEQIHLGSLLLAFTLAWTYFNFSQYMLIWIGNLPEEIPYYLKRTRGGWGWYAAIAVVFHFPIPFLLLLFRRVKSSPTALRNICLMLLVVVFFDELWWIAPTLDHSHAPAFYLLLDVAAWLGVGGIWLFVYLTMLKKNTLLPTRETYLLEAYHHGH